MTTKINTSDTRVQDIQTQFSKIEDKRRSGALEEIPALARNFIEAATALQQHKEQLQLQGREITENPELRRTKADLAAVSEYEESAKNLGSFLVRMLQEFFVTDNQLQFKNPEPYVGHFVWLHNYISDREKEIEQIKNLTAAFNSSSSSSCSSSSSSSLSSTS